MEIYLEDLKKEKQKEVLEFYGADENDNWDISPLFILERD